VTIYGYLVRLAVATWGLDWLRRGTASIRFLRPVYHGDEVTLTGQVVARSANPVAGETVAELEARAPGGEVAASLLAGLSWGGPVMAPDPRSYPAARLPEAPPGATEGTLRAVGSLGTPVLVLDAGTLTGAADDLDDPSPVYRGPDGVAHPGLLLRQANRALSENFRLGPWIHAASDVAHCGVARAQDRVETRGRVARTYERKGRGWVDLDLLLVVDGVRPIARIHHTAIYDLGTSR
jgi:hypothetical protein